MREEVKESRSPPAGQQSPMKAEEDPEEYNDVYKMLEEMAGLIK